MTAWRHDGLTVPWAAVDPDSQFPAVRHATIGGHCGGPTVRSRPKHETGCMTWTRPVAGQPQTQVGAGWTDHPMDKPVYCSELPV